MKIECPTCEGRRLVNKIYGFGLFKASIGSICETCFGRGYIEVDNTVKNMIIEVKHGISGK